VACRPKPITEYEPNVFHPAAVCHGPIADSIDLGLVEEFRTVSSFATKPVKITMTGPQRRSVSGLFFCQGRGSIDLRMNDVNTRSSS
jgi:hypothetical protein